MKPFQSLLEALSGGFLVAIHSHFLHSFLGLFEPLSFSIRKVPLIGETNNTLVPRARNNTIRRVSELECKTLFNELFGNLGLHIAHLLSSVFSHKHHSLGESPGVACGLCFFKERIILAGDLHLLTHGLSAPLPKSLDINNLNHVVWENPLILHTKLLSEFLLLLEILHRSPISRGIRGNTSNNPGSLVHENCKHWKSVDRVILCPKWRGESNTNKILPLNGGDERLLFPIFE
mmetsp:Transcript_21663/g.33661  ORF Transcript_21663/g.33661 Transcript_21663/m.33661 type:complete len:233 (-) Transcript_21663:219-917(-)